MKLLHKFNTCSLILLLLGAYSYAQEGNNRPVFIRIFSLQTCPHPQYGNNKTLVSNDSVCFLKVKFDHDQMKNEYKGTHESMTKKPECTKMVNEDYDSIVNFIMTSGLLNLDMEYSKPDTNGGITVMHSGGCSYNYFIETSEKKYDLLVQTGYSFKLPPELRSLTNSSEE